MGKASITIAVSSVFNGNGFDKAIDSATKLGSKLSRMEKLTASNASSMAQNVGKIGREWEAAGNRIENTGKKVAALGDSLTKSLTLPMVSAGVYAGKMAVDFDTALANVRKTSDLTERQLEDLARSAIELSKTQPVDAKTILNIEALGAQLGISNGKLEDFAKTVSGLDIATNMNAETAATELARFANIVGMTEDEFSNYGSTIVAIGNNMATTESEVSQMAMRFASAGAQAGLSEAQILGMAGAMSSLGIKAEMGGSALSQIFVSIGKAVASGGDELEAFASRANMSADEFKRAWGDDAAGAFNALIEGIGGAAASGEDMNVIMSELGFTQIRQSDVMRRLAGSTEAVTNKQSVLSGALELSTSAWEKNTALQKEVDQRNESMASRLEVLKNKVDAIAITVGRPLVDAVIDALEALDPLITGVANAAQAFSDMDEEGQRNILMWAGVAAAAGPVLSITGRMAQGFGHIVKAFGETTSKVAVFTDAMSNLDGANLRTYGSSKSLASAMGLARNEAVKAAGGVDNYVEAWDNMVVAAGRAKKSEKAMEDAMAAANRATGDARESLLAKAQAHNLDNIAAVDDYRANARLVSAFGKSTKEAEKAAKGIKTLEPSLRSVEQGMGHSEKVIENYSKSLKSADKAASGASITLGQGLVNGAKMAATGMMGFIKACAPMVAVTATVAAVGMVVSDLADQAKKAQERQDLLAESSATFADISSRASAGAQSQAAGIGSIADEARNALEGVKAMNEQAAQTMAEFETSAATLDEYTNTITALGNKGRLTAIEQEKLKVAVDGYNEITGDSISITDAATGALSKTSDEIRDNARAWEENAHTQALQKVAQGYMEERAKAELAYSKALSERAANAQKVADIERELNSGVERGSDEWSTLTGQLIIANQELDESESALEEAEAALDSTTKSVDEATSAMSLSSAKLSDSVKKDIASQEIHLRDFAIAVATHLQDSGASVGTFQENLAAMGADTEKMSMMSAYNFDQLWKSCDGDVSMMIQKINEYNGIDILDKEAKLEAIGNIASGHAKQITKDTKKSIEELKGKRVFVDADGNYSWAKEQIWSLSSAIGSLPKHTLSIVDQIVNKKSGHASGGIALHASGGIATRATDITRHIAGEAGAEAIVPLTNRHYVTPFAQVVAQETVAAMRGGMSAQPVGNTYVLNINGAQFQSSSHRVMEAVEVIFNEMELMNTMGVR